jgi:hypoxanthine phosphoribosyltransferase
MRKYNFIKEIIVHPGQLIEISDRVSSEIKEFYENHYKSLKIIVLTLLEGGLKFSRSVVPQTLNISSFIIKAKSYGDNTKTSGRVELDFGFPGTEEFIFSQIPGKPVLIIDDIYETGITLDTVINLIKKHNPASIECCVMVERVRKHVSDLNPRFVGIKVENPAFLVGAGLDFKGSYRNLPYIGTLKEDFNDEPQEEYFCNRCGKLCISDKEIENGIEKRSYYGLLNAVAKGHYFSPVLSDCIAYKFDICEICLREIFNSFIIPVEKKEYDIWSGNIYG